MNAKPIEYNSKINYRFLINLFHSLKFHLQIPHLTIRHYKHAFVFKNFLSNDQNSLHINDHMLIG